MGTIFNRIFSTFYGYPFNRIYAIILLKKEVIQITKSDKPYIINGERVTLEEYRKTKYEDLRIRVPKGKKDIIKEYVGTKNESLNSFVNRAIDETMERDKEAENS